VRVREKVEVGKSASPRLARARCRARGRSFFSLLFSLSPVSGRKALTTGRRQHGPQLIDSQRR